MHGATISPNGLELNGSVEPSTQFGDGALRIRTTFDSKTYQFALRAMEVGNGAYNLRVHTDGKVTLFWIADSRETKLQTYTPSQPIQPGHDYELELRMVSGKVTAKLNGQTLGEYTGPALRHVRFGLDAQQLVTIKSLEFLPLGSTPTPAKP